VSSRRVMDTSLGASMPTLVDPCFASIIVMVMVSSMTIASLSLRVMMSIRASFSLVSVVTGARGCKSGDREVSWRGGKLLDPRVGMFGD